jgi:hypothetical protein
MSQCQRVWFFPDTTIPLQESYYFWDNSNLSKYMSVEVLVHYKNGRLYHCLVNLEKDVLRTFTIGKKIKIKLTTIYQIFGIITRM